MFSISRGIVSEKLLARLLFMSETFDCTSQTAEWDKAAQIVGKDHFDPPESQEVMSQDKNVDRSSSREMESGESVGSAP